MECKADTCNQQWYWCNSSTRKIMVVIKRQIWTNSSPHAQTLQGSWYNLWVKEIDPFKLLISFLIMTNEQWTMIDKSINSSIIDSLSCYGAVDKILISQLNCEVPSSNLHAMSVVSLGKALYPHCPVPRRRLKSVRLLVALFLYFHYHFSLWSFTCTYYYFETSNYLILFYK